MAFPAHFLIPGSLAQRTGGYLYDERVIRGLQERGWLIGVHELPESGWPLLARTERAACEAVLYTLPDEALVVIDGLALAGLLPMLPELAGRARVMALVHCPLYRETGLSPALKARLREEERQALGYVARIVTTSDWAAGDVSRSFGIRRGHIGVVPPGVDPAPVAAGVGGRLLCVAGLTQRKNQLTLLHALAELRALSWTLHLVGSDQRDPGYAARVRATVRSLELEERVTLTGELSGEDLEREYHEADVFVLPSWYETFGMVLTEALARGLPVVCTSGSAIPATVPEPARITVPPGDTQALAKALRRVLTDDGARAALADGARGARGRLQRWDEAVHGFARELSLLRRA